MYLLHNMYLSTSSPPKIVVFGLQIVKLEKIPPFQFNMVDHIYKTFKPTYDFLAYYV